MIYYVLLSSSKESFFERFPELSENEVIIFDLGFFHECPYHDPQVRGWAQSPSVNKACETFNNFLHLFSEDRDSKEVWIERGTGLTVELKNKSFRKPGIKVEKSPLDKIELLCENKGARITYISLVIQEELVALA